MIFRAVHRICGFCILPIIIALFITINSHSSRTDYLTLHPKGLRPMHIYRDDYGQATIKADSYSDSLYALGYSHGQDRLWQMHVTRMLISGRLSEVFGEKAINLDKYFRTLSFGRYSKKIYDNLTPKSIKWLKAYVEGINFYVSERIYLPVEFWITGSKWEPWRIEDTLLLSNFMSFALSTDWQWELAWDRLVDVLGLETTQRFFPTSSKKILYPDAVIMNDDDLKQSNIYDEYKGDLEDECEIIKALQIPSKCNKKQQSQDGKDEKDASQTNNKQNSKSQSSKQTTTTSSSSTSSKRIPADDIQTKDISDKLSSRTAAASNAWVIHGNHTKTGKPILAADPHLDNAIPSTWLQTNIMIPDNYIHGVSFAGIPGVLIGKTKYITWGMTTFYGDTTDIYREVVSPDNKTYLHDGKQLPLKAYQEQIRVKGQEEPINHTVYATHHGPILDVYLPKAFDHTFYKSPNHRYSLAWAGYDKRDVLESYLGFLRAKTLKEVFKFVKNFVVPSQSALFATAEGDIAFLVTGRAPIRKHQRQGALVKDGTSSEYDWQGFIPFEEMPHVINPKKGYIIAANNKVATDNIKYRISLNQWTTPRGQRINEMIKNLIKDGNKVTAQDMMKLQTDTVDVWARDFSPVMVNLTLSYKDMYAEFRSNKNISQIAGFMKQWNGDYNKELPFPTIQAYWERQFSKLSFKSYEWDDDERSRLTQNIVYDHFFFRSVKQFGEGKGLDQEWCLNEHNKDHKNKCIYNLILALVKTHDYLASRFGPNFNEWKYKKVHHMVYAHLPFSETPLRDIFHRELPASGSARTVNVARGGYSEEQQMFLSKYSANLRMIASMDKKDISYYSIDTGNSENPFSRNYDDQVARHERGEYLVMKSGKKALIQEEDDVKIADIIDYFD